MKAVEVTVENTGNNLSAYLDSCKEMNIAPVEVLQGEFTLKFKIDK